MILLTFGAFTKLGALKILIIRVVSLLCGLFIVGVMLWELTKVYVNQNLRSNLETGIVCNRNVPRINFSIGFILKNAEQWFNLHQNVGVFTAILPYFLFLVAITLLRAIKITQSMKRPAETEPEVVFEDVNGGNADESFANLLKYHVNYGFYNFAKEIILAMFIVVIFTRLNMFAIFYIVWMIILLPHRFETNETLWKIATLSVMVSLAVQCVILLIFVFIEPCRSHTRMDTDAPAMAIVRILYDHFQSVYDHPETLIYDFILLVLLNCKVSDKQSFQKNFGSFLKVFPPTLKLCSKAFC